MNKLVKIALGTLVLSTLSVSTAFAHYGEHTGSGNCVMYCQGYNFESCTVSGCSEQGIHQHGDNYYCTHNETCVHHDDTTVVAPAATTTPAVTQPAAPTYQQPQYNYGGHHGGGHHGGRHH